MGSHQDLLLRYRLTDFYKMVSLKVVLAFAIMSSTVAIFVFRPPSKECRSDRDCQTFRRTSSRRQSYLLPGKCNKVPDTWCHIGSWYLFANFFQKPSFSRFLWEAKPLQRWIALR